MRKTNKVLGRSSWDALFSCLAPVTKHPYRRLHEHTYPVHRKLDPAGIDPEP
jgi:hypothetical protein